MSTTDHPSPTNDPFTPRPGAAGHAPRPGDRDPRRDLDDPGQIGEMVRRFYRDVAQDDVLGPVFNDVAQVDWAEHLPKLTAFWCRALLSMPGYEGNPYRMHQEIHARSPLARRHFERWLDLFHETVDLGWRGPKAEQAKGLARKVAMVHSKQIVGDTVVYEPPGDPATHSVEPTAQPTAVAIVPGRAPR